MDRRLTREALRLMDAHQPFVRATVVASEGSVPGKVGASMIVRSDGSTAGTVGGAALEETVKRLAGEAMEARTSRLVHFDLKKWVDGGLPSLCGGSVEIAIEFVPARPNVLIWGGGHVAYALARLLPTLEYDYSVADDRSDWVGEERFPEAERRETVGPRELFERLPPTEYTHLYVLGYDAAKDLDVLDVALREFPNRIGLIASEAKRAHLFDSLRHRGHPPESLARIRSPVGLPIGAQSPEEIAVSIVAEIVQGMHPSPSPNSPGGSGAREPAPHDPLRTP